MKIFFISFLFCVSLAIEEQNLDTNYPFMYSSGSEETQGYFGLSVALRPKAAHFNSSW